MYISFSAENLFSLLRVSSTPKTILPSSLRGVPAPNTKSRLGSMITFGTILPLVKIVSVFVTAPSNFNSTFNTAFSGYFFNSTVSILLTPSGTSNEKLSSLWVEIPMVSFGNSKGTSMGGSVSDRTVRYPSFNKAGVIASTGSMFTSKASGSRAYSVIPEPYLSVSSMTGSTKSSNDISFILRFKLEVCSMPGMLKSFRLMSPKLTKMGSGLKC